MSGEECSLSIDTRSGTGEVRTKGRYYYKRGKHQVLFDIEGDRCRIEFDENGLDYIRKGSLSYTLNLREGCEIDSVMRTPFGESTLTGRTYRYGLTEKEQEIRISIGYDIAGENCDMEIDISKEMKT